MSIVYALHEPARWDRVTRTMVPIDLNRAKPFGVVKVVFPGPDRPPPIAQCAETLKAAMAGFQACDRLLIAGDMDLVAFAAVLAAKATDGKLTLLKWDSRDRQYYEVVAPEGLLS